MTIPCGRYEWERIIRRATILDLTAKGFALILASYADPDGTRVFPGTKRLANVTGRSPRSVFRMLSALQSAGLIRCVSKAGQNGRKREYDEYQLTIPADPVTALGMLDPDDNHVTSVTPGLVVYPQEQAAS